MKILVLSRSRSLVLQCMLGLLAITSVIPNPVPLRAASSSENLSALTPWLVATGAGLVALWAWRKAHRAEQAIADLMQRVTQLQHGEPGRVGDAVVEMQRALTMHSDRIILLEQSRTTVQATLAVLVQRPVGLARNLFERFEAARIAESKAQSEALTMLEARTAGLMDRMENLEQSLQRRVSL